MTVNEAKKKFNVLKEAILADNKVDLSEVEVLLDFVEGYIVNDKFLKFKSILLECKKDGKITHEESDMIIKEIEFLSKFLTIETIIEKIVIWTVSVLLVGSLAWMLFFK